MAILAYVGWVPSGDDSWDAVGCIGTSCKTLAASAMTLAELAMDLISVSMAAVMDCRVGWMFLVTSVRLVVVLLICWEVKVSAFMASMISMVCFAWSVVDAFRKAHSCSSSFISGSAMERSFSPNVIASSSEKDE